MEEKKKKSEFLSYNLMLNSEKKIRALRDKNNYSNSCFVRKKISVRNKLEAQPTEPVSLTWQ